jgi:hypothetical protein
MINPINMGNIQTEQMPSIYNQYILLHSKNNQSKTFQADDSDLQQPGVAGEHVLRPLSE